MFMFSGSILIGNVSLGIDLDAFRDFISVNIALIIMNSKFKRFGPL